MGEDIGEGKVPTGIKLAVPCQTPVCLPSLSPSLSPDWERETRRKCGERGHKRETEERGK
jgi:hypothetical protein